MLDVLLVQNPVTYSNRTSLVSDFPRLGLLYLGAVLERGGVSVEVLENRDRKYSLEQILSLITEKNPLLSKKPLILGLSSMTSNMRGSYQLAKAVKDKFGDQISIGLGGPHVSADPEVIKRFPVFDWAVTGEAEITFPEVVKRIKGGERVRGIFQGQACSSLDELPFPAWHLVDWGRYQLRSNNIMASRGCPFRCIFCSIPAIERRTR
ncbi:cobalamin-dependent protein [Candidatus Parcubacteria bacterium]|nr:cobalamin-dependent protein [Candidatus Parcubacteria bacterium]